MKFSYVAKVIFSAALSQSTLAFAPCGILRCDTNGRNISSIHLISKSTGRHAPVFSKSGTQLFAQSTDGSGEDGFFSNLAFQPGYAALYAIFFLVATYMTLNETSGASQTLIERFVADPQNPGFGSSIFETVWNELGFIGLPLACLVMPGAKGQKINPTPFLFGSMFAGYGSLGIFMSIRTPRPSIDKEDLGWFTKNVLENKIFNWALVAFFALTYVNSGAAQSLLFDFSGTIQEFKGMISGSALGTASSVDFMILCLTGASLVSEDLKRRGFDDDAKAKAIAASTLLIPGVGLSLYAALRPSLNEE